MLHPHDPMNSPTPVQEALYAKDCEIAALREQIVEAYRLLNMSTVQHDHDSESTAYFNDKEGWLDQNESIAKESA